MMAHTIDGKGPYPDKAGEFCGNFHPDELPTRLFNESFAEAAERQKEWLGRMRFGKPSNCQVGTSEEMAAAGEVGLYLKEDRALFDWETPVETDELTEPIVTMRKLIGGLNDAKDTTRN